MSTQTLSQRIEAAAAHRGLKICSTGHYADKNGALWLVYADEAYESLGMTKVVPPIQFSRATGALSEDERRSLFPDRA